ncbi:MAG: hypothetical protein OXI79_15035 [Gammaproteobacteria bacterium]|nr:hypothetical protein [Gammaproteobacteria bacterium]
MIKDLIREGWGYHDTESERLADELEGADLDVWQGDEPAQCLMLANHTIGEHLGDWARARRFAEAVHGAGPGSGSPGVGVHLAVARYMDDAPIAAQGAEVDAVQAADDPLAAYLSVKSSLARALAGSGRCADAGLVIRAANRLAGSLAESRASDRGMAVANNNLASELVESENLDAEESRLMLDCAEAAHTFWKRCGTWVNEERALYLLALVHNRAGDHGRAIGFANAALDLIAANGEQPVDEAFIRLAAATAHTVRAEEASAARCLAEADELAGSWTDQSHIDWYRSERAKVSVP